MCGFEPKRVFQFFKTNPIMSYWRQAFTDWNTLFFEELRTIFRDLGVLIFFFIVPLGYPLLYTFIYTNEVVREVPIVVVDDCRSTQSREYVRHLDATPTLKLYPMQPTCPRPAS